MFVCGLDVVFGEGKCVVGRGHKHSRCQRSFLQILNVFRVRVVNGFSHSFLAPLTSSPLVTSKPCKTPPKLVLHP
jgi:hypothetical protein